MKIVLKEDQLWNQFDYMLLAEKYRFSVTFVTEYDDFVAEFKPPNRASKGIPRSEVSAKYTQRFYKKSDVKIPKSLKEMDDTLTLIHENLKKGVWS